MKAAMLENIRQIPYIEIQTPKPGIQEVLLQVQTVSICGSDIKRVLEGHRKMPLILGHECAGTVVEVGEGVDTSIIGMRAAVIPLVPCFKCKQCNQGLYSACDSYSFIGSRQNGCFAEYVTLPVSNLLPIGNNIKFEEAALFEPLTVVIHGLNRVGFTSGGSVVVLGAGSLGMLAIQWLRLKGADLIIASDVDDERLELASHLGAHLTINPNKKKIAAEVMAATGEGADLVLELAGVPQTLQDAITAARPQAKVLLTGNQPKGSVVPGDWIEQILRKELSLYGTWMSYSAPFPGPEWQEVMCAQLSGDLSLAEVISHRFPLSEIPRIFEGIASRQLSFRKIMLFPGKNGGQKDVNR
jgi:L-iditol 2-dehydrogenase